MNQQRGKRVLMLLENADFPGDDRVRHEAAALASAGYRVIVIAPSDKGAARHEYINGIEVYRYPAPFVPAGFIGYAVEYGYSMLALFAFSLFVWARRGFDIIHSAQPPDTFVFIAAFYKLFGKFYMLDLHDLAPELYFARFRGKGNRRLQQLLYWLERLSFRAADHVICTNQSYRQVALERGGVEDRRITIVRNGPDLQEQQSVAVDLALRSRGKKIIGYVGVTGVQDGVDNLLRALYHLQCDLGRTDFLCVIVGNGSAMPGLKTLCAQLQLETQIIFTGWVHGVDEVTRYLNSMDLCIAPEPSDPYNDRSTAVKVMEYMAAAKPIVSSDLPEHRLTAGDAAIYARAGDAMDLARKIADLLDDRDRREAMGRIGRTRIETQLAWPYQARRLLEAFEAVTLSHSQDIPKPPAK